MKAPWRNQIDSLAVFFLFLSFFCFCGTVGQVSAGVVGSAHDFTGDNFAPAGVCSACHQVHYADDSQAIWSRDMSDETGDFSQTADPNYVPDMTILCYDCHESGYGDSDPSAVGFDPQDVAFTDGPGPPQGSGGSNPENIGYYEIKDGTLPPPASINDITGGHYWKDTPDNSGVPYYEKGDKLACVICHDPHDAKTGTGLDHNEAMILTETSDGMGGTVEIGIGLKKSTNATYGTDDGREICIGCHGDSDSNTPKQMWNVNLPRPTTVLPEHSSSDVNTPCTDCHRHNFITAQCPDCHGYPPPPSYEASSYSSWPGAIDETLGPHPKHSDLVANGGYAFSCHECHRNYNLTPPNDTHWDGVYDDVVFDNVVVRNPTGTYNGNTNTCSSLYCHSRGTSINDTLNNTGGNTIIWTGSTTPGENWSTDDLGCEACHGEVGTPRTEGVTVEYGAPGYDNGTPKANSHGSHPYPCAYCHYSVITDTDYTDGWTIDDVSLHVNNLQSSFTYNVNPIPNGSTDIGSPGFIFSSYTYNAAGGSCADIDCHGGNPADWGSTTLTCLDCHSRTTANGGDRNNWAGNDNTPSMVDTDEYAAVGHGAQALACTDCHNKDIVHDTSAGLSGGNPFRLDNINIVGQEYTDPDSFCSDTTNCHTGAVSSTVVSHTDENMSRDKRTWPAWNPKCVDCHDPHGEQTNLSMVQYDLFDAGSTTHGVPNSSDADTVDFTVRDGGLVDGGFADTTDANGICQECHTAIDPLPQLSFLDNDTAVLHGSHPSGGLDRCYTCHVHSSAFEPTGCKGCHGLDCYVHPGLDGSCGGGDDAPNVMTVDAAGDPIPCTDPPPSSCYDKWGGEWWDDIQGTSTDGTYQQGGHGDLDGREGGNTDNEIECTDCHDIGDPPVPHPDGIYNDVFTGSNTTENTDHLLSGFVAGDASPDHEIQVTFDNYCYSLCHAGETPAIIDMRHERDGDPAAGAVQFGTHLTVPDGTTTNLPVDCYIDNTKSCGVPPPNYAPCVSCHDPHGTTCTDTRGNKSATSNRMLRDDWQNKNAFLCKECHL